MAALENNSMVKAIFHFGKDHVTGTLSELVIPAHFTSSFIILFILFYYVFYVTIELLNSIFIFTSSGKKHRLSCLPHFFPVDQ